MSTNRLQLGVAAATGALFATIVFAGPSLAQDNPSITSEDPPATVETETTESGAGHVIGGPEVIDCAVAPENWEPTAAEINTETDELVEFLAENGVEVTVETDEYGIRFPAFDEDTPEHVFELVDQFFQERYPESGIIEGLPDDCVDIELAGCEFLPPPGEGNPANREPAPAG